MADLQRGGACAPRGAGGGQALSFAEPVRELTPCKVPARPYGTGPWQALLDPSDRREDHDRDSPPANASRRAGGRLAGGEGPRRGARPAKTVTPGHRKKPRRRTLDIHSKEKLT